MKLNIILICDDQYVMPTLVTMTSIVENCDSKSEIIFHILTYNLSEKNQNEFQQFEEKRNANVHIYDQTTNDNYKRKLKQITQKSHVTPTALLKFEISNILPNNIDVVCYLDSDIIVKGDISEIFQQKLGSSLIAASYEFWKYKMKYYIFSENYQVPDFYFNSGVLLMNLKELRKQNLSLCLWKNKEQMLNDSSNKSFLMDQDVLNNVLGNECIHLPIRFNCNPTFIEKEDIKSLNNIYGTNYKTPEDIYNDAIIIHFVGKEDKPWKYSNGHCRKLWDKYFIDAGYDFSDLKRSSNRSSLNKKIGKFFVRIQNDGFNNTIKYLIARGRKAF